RLLQPGELDVDCQSGDLLLQLVAISRVPFIVRWQCCVFLQQSLRDQIGDATGAVAGVGVSMRNASSFRGDLLVLQPTSLCHGESPYSSSAGLIRQSAIHTVFSSPLCT